jgi:hypothetical protein
VKSSENGVGVVGLESVQDVVDGGELSGELLVGLGAEDVGQTHIGDHALEGLGLLDSRWVVEGEDSDNRSWVDGDSRLLDELNEAREDLGQQDHSSLREKKREDEPERVQPPGR